MQYRIYTLDVSVTLTFHGLIQYFYGIIQVDVCLMSWEKWFEKYVSRKLKQFSRHILKQRFTHLTIEAIDLY